MFKLNKKLVSTGRNGEMFKKTFLLEGKALIKLLNRLLYNLDNGFH